MNYDVCGPFEVPRDGRTFKGEHVSKFWDEVEDYWDGLSRAIGVYVFSVRFNQDYKPWYIGRTNALSGFRGEVFQSHKMHHYIKSTERKNGCPVVHLIPKLRPALGSFSTASDVAERETDALETAMIAMALQVNPNLRNSKKTWFMRNCQVPGILGRPVKGRRPDGVATLRNVFGKT